MYVIDNSTKWHIWYLPRCDFLITLGDTENIQMQIAKWHTCAFITVIGAYMFARAGLKKQVQSFFRISNSMVVINFYRAMLAQSAVMRLLSSVCLSVCLSVTIRYRVQIRWNSSKIISRPNSLGPMCWLTPNIGDLVQREHPQNWG